jgi:hypothetical protein
MAAELVFIKKRTGKEDAFEVVSAHRLPFLEKKGSVATYSTEMSALQAGVFEYAFRLFPVHPLLPHRQDFPLITWV